MYISMCDFPKNIYTSVTTVLVPCVLGVPSAFYCIRLSLLRCSKSEKSSVGSPAARPGGVKSCRFQFLWERLLVMGLPAGHATAQPGILFCLWFWLLSFASMLSFSYVFVNQSHWLGTFKRCLSNLWLVVSRSRANQRLGVTNLSLLLRVC